MGMMTYEAITAGAYPIVFCRSEDHVTSADKLQELNLASNLGLLTHPTKEHSVEEMANQIESIYESHVSSHLDWPSLNFAGRFLDGKGTYRVAQEILHG
jgi:hypothetical protein